MPALVNDIAYSTVRQKIDKLIDNLVNITDETGEFLLKLEDGRIIDTKGWNDWEWTHGIGLYGLLKYWDITGDDKAREIIEDWFANPSDYRGQRKLLYRKLVAPFLDRFPETRSEMEFYSDDVFTFHT